MTTTNVLGGVNLDRDLDTIRRSYSRGTAITTVLAVAFYAFLSGGSKFVSTGGVDSDGSYVDMNGAATSVIPQDVSMSMRPSWYIIATFVVIALAAMFIAKCRAHTAADVVRIHARSTWIMIAVVVIALAVTWVWFFAFDGAELAVTHILVYPWPLNVDITIQPTAG